MDMHNVLWGVLFLIPLLGYVLVALPLSTRSKVIVGSATLAILIAIPIALAAVSA